MNAEAVVTECAQQTAAWWIPILITLVVVGGGALLALTVKLLGSSAVESWEGSRVTKTPPCPLCANEVENRVAAHTFCRRKLKTHLHVCCNLCDHDWIPLNMKVAPR